MKSQYCNSITVDELIKVLQEYSDKSAGNGKKMIYFDCLHIEGKFSELPENKVELY